ncbi:hypothetical protein XENTR_v10018845 [Xenopus tropicalis]|nr:hypothetical protein XENTR_v10018845 [Xenopus tropicalis]
MDAFIFQHSACNRRTQTSDWLPWVTAQVQEQHSCTLCFMEAVQVDIIATKLLLDQKIRHLVRRQVSHGIQIGAQRLAASYTGWDPA